MGDTAKQLRSSDRIELAIRYQQAGQLDQAEKIYRDVLSQEPSQSDALHLLGTIALQLGKFDDAIPLFRRAIGVNPSVAFYHCNLGIALREIRQFDESIQACQRAVALQPDYFDAHNNLAYALLGKGDVDAAVHAYRRAIALKPSLAETYCNLSNALLAKGEFEESRNVLYQALRINPECALAHWNLRLSFLRVGEFAAGWKEHKWRWRRFPSQLPKFTEPVWDFSDPRGKTIFLYPDEGFGDTIQFIRYAPLIAARGGRVVIACQPELTRLLQTQRSLGEVLSDGASLPLFDYHCPISSLPSVFGTELHSIPDSVPYLTADNTLVQHWHRLIAPARDRQKIGLVWAGNPLVQDDHQRSLGLQQLQAFSGVGNATFFSLQKGPAAVQALNPPRGMDLIDLGSATSDFADTAAIISSLDLVVTSDTSVAHLAGAIGKPVWLMLQFVPDWRWLLNRDDSPWYPTMRLFRQTRPGEWGGVIVRVAEALQLLSRRGQTF